jgi:hypothetical protein
MIVRIPGSGSSAALVGRMLPAVAGLAVLTGAITMLVALIDAPGPWLQGYVSEAGSAGQPLARAYRSGVILLACGALMLALSFLRLGRTASPGRAGAMLRAGAALLASAAVLAATSGAVSCSDRCPLPPFEPTTAADVLHAAASIAGMVALAAAMSLIALAPLRLAIRRLAAAAVAVTVPLGACLGLIMLLVGRSAVGAVTERALLVVAVSWLIGTAALLRSCWPLDATT